jgi:hypothetical protein
MQHPKYNKHHRMYQTQHPGHSVGGIGNVINQNLYAKYTLKTNEMHDI